MKSIKKQLHYGIILILAAMATAYLFHIDDEGYPKSQDSLTVIISVGTFYTLLLSLPIGAVYFGIKYFISRPSNK